MVRRTFNQSVVFGGSRPCLRSDKGASMDPGQIESPNHWKGLLSSNRKSVSNFSNGHHTRSNKITEEKANKSPNPKDSLEIQCNGLSTLRSYETRYGGRNIDHRSVPTRRNSHREECSATMARLTHNRTSSASLPNSHDVLQPSPSGSDSGHKLRPRGQGLLSNSVVSVADDTERTATQSRMPSSPNQHTLKVRQEGKTDTGQRNNSSLIKDERRGRNIDSKQLHGHSQMIKKKRLTAEEKLIEDNRAYYKLEVKNSKLRSSGYIIHQRELCLPSMNEESKGSECNIPRGGNATCNGEQSQTDSQNANNAVKIKKNKIRLSELSLLNNEAENFMFGEPTRKDESSSSQSSSESDTSDEDESNKSGKQLKINNKDCNAEVEGKENVRNVNNRCTEKSLTKNMCELEMRKISSPLQNEDNNQIPTHLLHCDESSVGSLGSCSVASSYETNTTDGCQRKKKRRTHAEAFIHDNLDYYKFEIPGSRLRFQGSILPPITVNMKTVLDVETCNSNKDTGTNTTISKMCNVQQYGCQHSDTDVPSNAACNSEKQKPGISNSGRLSENVEKLTVYDKPSSIKHEASDGLHFSFEAIPVSEPWYQTYHRQDEGEEFYLSNANDCTYWKAFLLPYEMSTEGLNTANTGRPTKCSNSINVKKRRKKLYANLLDKKPRKSPRCHASTLAILSSLMHHRKRKEPDKTKQGEGDDDDYDDEEEEEEKELPAKTKAASAESIKMKEIAQNIDEVFVLYPETGLPDCRTQVRDTGSELNSGRHTKCKVSKSKKLHKLSNTVNAKKSVAPCVASREADEIDIDPLVLEELVSCGENPLDSLVEPTVRCRGGPSMDVITLLEGYTECCCVDDVAIPGKDCENCDSVQPSAVRETCNSSECASSTCETVAYSDVPECVVRVRGKKRKRKKNLTGWPVEKQKLKKRMLLKLAKNEMNVSIQGAESQLNSASDKVHKLSVGQSVSVEVREKTQCTQEVNVPSEAVINSDTGSAFGPDSVIKDTSAGGGNTLKSSVTNICDVSKDRKSPNNEKSESVCAINKLSSRATITRTGSIDSNCQLSEFQPQVRVKKMNSISDIHFVTSSSLSHSLSVTNTRHLRSGSSSSSVPKKRKHFYSSKEKVDVVPVRRASSRKRIPRFGTRWDSWSTRRRR